MIYINFNANRDRANGLAERKGGFTLVELLVSMAILGLLVVLISMAFNSASDLFVRNTNKIELNQVVRGVFLQITRDLERTIYLTNAICLYQAGPGAKYIPGMGIYSNALYCLALLPATEPSPLGNPTVVGYNIMYTNLDGTARWVLVRGNDEFVDTAGVCSNNWWISNPPTCPLQPDFWKVLSENIIGIEFEHYTNALANDTSLPAISWPGMNGIPYSIGVTLWAIDTVAYDKALAVDPLLLKPVAQSILSNNVQVYYTRIFLPNSTQNP